MYLIRPNIAFERNFNNLFTKLFMSITQNNYNLFGEVLKNHYNIIYNYENVLELQIFLLNQKILFFKHSIHAYFRMEQKEMTGFESP